MEQRNNPHSQSLRPIGPTHDNGRTVGTVLLAGDNGNWLIARKEQLMAYLFILSRRPIEKTYKFNYVVVDGKQEHLFVRRRRFIPYVHSHMEVIEIQDQYKGGKWREIKELELAPTPKSS